MVSENDSLNPRSFWKASHPFENNGEHAVIKHSNGISPFFIGNTSSKGPFSIAMLDYRSVNPKNTPSLLSVLLSLHGVIVATIPTIGPKHHVIHVSLNGEL